MAYPDWAGPFGIPTEKDELLASVLTTAGVAAFSGSLYAYEIGRTIPRMANHHIYNRLGQRYATRQLIATAARQTIFPSPTNALSLYSRVWAGGHVRAAGRGAMSVARALPTAAVPAAGIGLMYGLHQTNQQAFTNVAEGRPSWLGIVPAPIAGLLGWA